MINQIRTQYREIRRQVFEQATMPAEVNSQRHSENKARFRAAAEQLSNNASLDHWASNSSEAKTGLWNHLWIKNRYAGIRAQIATNEIAQIKHLFDDYSWFSDPRWDLRSKGFQVISAGEFARNFLDRTGPFTNLQTIGNVPKLKKIISIARLYDQYFSQHPQAPAIEFLNHSIELEDVWAIHAGLMDIDYKGDLTALHFMMDAGFQVIKPDVVISRLLLDWGWLRYAKPDLPNDLTRDDLLGKGKYGTRYMYMKPLIYKPIIDLAREIVSGIDPQSLIDDIGWVTSNPMREFDIFIVKSGQLPEKEFGIERRLYS